MKFEPDDFWNDDSYAKATDGRNGKYISIPLDIAAKIANAKLEKWLERHDYRNQTQFPIVIRSRWCGGPTSEDITYCIYPGDAIRIDTVGLIKEVEKILEEKLNHACLYLGHMFDNVIRQGYMTFSSSSGKWCTEYRIIYCRRCGFIQDILEAK